MEPLFVCVDIHVVEKDGKRIATEIFVYGFVNKFLSTLLVVPVG